MRGLAKQSRRRWRRSCRGLKVPESFSEADAVALLEALRGSKCGPSGSSGMAKARLHTCGGPGRRPALATARQGRRI